MMSLARLSFQRRLSSQPSRIFRLGADRSWQTSAVCAGVLLFGMGYSYDAILLRPKREEEERRRQLRKEKLEDARRERREEIWADSKAAVKTTGAIVKEHAPEVLEKAIAATEGIKERGAEVAEDAKLAGARLKERLQQSRG